MTGPGKEVFEAVVAYGTRLVGERDALIAALRDAADLAAELVPKAYPQSDVIQNSLKSQCAVWRDLAQRVQDGAAPEPSKGKP